MNRIMIVAIATSLALGSIAENVHDAGRALAENYTVGEASKMMQDVFGHLAFLPRMSFLQLRRWATRIATVAGTMGEGRQAAAAPCRSQSSTRQMSHSLKVAKRATSH